mmetsp:Transcript_1040/g.3150  ORF Transcript_1040/g.3150 Transcript_1040/m.3150 type:complete len:270 (+) Transcript_1040:668-1477(+)
MFMHPGMGGGGGGGSIINRPMFIMTVFAMLFLTVHTDWGGHHAAELRRTGGGPAQAPDADPRKGVHEKIIYELSVGAERLEQENQALKQHVLDLRRAARAAGLQLNESATFLPIPGLDDILVKASATTGVSAATSRHSEGSDASTAADLGEGLLGNFSGGGATEPDDSADDSSVASDPGTAPLVAEGTRKGVLGGSGRKGLGKGWRRKMRGVDRALDLGSDRAQGHIGWQLQQQNLLGGRSSSPRVEGLAAYGIRNRDSRNRFQRQSRH